MRKAILDFFDGKIMSSFRNKLLLVSFLCVFISLVLFSLMVNSGFNRIYRESKEQVGGSVEALSVDYLNGYINVTGKYVEEKINSYVNELSILGDIYQRYYDERGNFGNITTAIGTNPKTKDVLTYNGKWISDENDYGTGVLVPKYLLASDGTIPAGILAEMKTSSILDLVLPSFYENGTKKLGVYFSGSEKKDFYRAAPWSNIGEALYKVYPQFVDTPMMETFNPGYQATWESRVKATPALLKDRKAMTTFKQITQDGLTGSIIMTVGTPIWDREKGTLEGIISMDIEITAIVNYISGLSVDNGIVFLSQSSGNIFALSKDGEERLGLKTVEESTAQGTTGFHVMERFFKDSKYIPVQNIEAPTDAQTHIRELDIDGTRYRLVLKKLSPLNSWENRKTLYDEYWTLGMLVPNDSIVKTTNVAGDRIDRLRIDIVSLLALLGIVLIVTSGLIILYVTGKMTTGLTRLEEAALEAVNENYGTQIEIESKDEIGKLGHAFNKMMHEMRNSLEHQENQNELLKKEISDRINREKQIKYMEEYDDLTNLPKNVVLFTRLEEAARKKMGAVLIVGLDNFRNVNEVLGHEGGNSILRLVARRIVNTVKDADIISRFSGDEFAVLISDLHSTAVVAEKAELIQQQIKQVYKIFGSEIYLTASVGISMFPMDGRVASDLIRFASSALINAKLKGKGRIQFYDIEINKIAEKRSKLLGELSHALSRHEFEIYYQPKIEVRTKKIIGFEALLRWNNRTNGQISPNVFIPLAEDSGIIYDIGRWVLKEACTQAVEWMRLSGRRFTISVNISPIQFDQAGFREEIESIIESTGIRPDCLELEVTESLFINDMEKASEILTRLRKLGVQVAVDDFGKGYSSLSYLRKLPIDSLKIDRSFIMDVPAKDDGKIAELIVSLGKAIGVRTVAEGIETVAQFEFLKNAGCDEIQGFLVGKPANRETTVLRLSELK